ncbi:hypothetical protein AURDEDRAFT_121748 [Auricularia subglabra TFB-10046 SS5]|nr:hypothetical protein AURDEDRAFT_121748 [Auricularia subglabra TFB-10046 SS5]
MSRASGSSGSGAGPSHSRGTGPGPGPGSGGAPRREARAIGRDPCKEPQCPCRNFWALVSVDDHGNIIPSSIDLTLPCLFCHHVLASHLGEPQAPDMLQSRPSIPHCPPTARCDDHEGCICLMFVFASRQDGDLLPRFICRCGHPYASHLRLQSGSNALDHDAMLAAAFPDPQPEPLPHGSFQTYHQSTDEPQGSANSRRTHSFINHRIKGPSGIPAAGVVGARPGPRVPAPGRVAQPRGAQRAAHLSSASQPYTNSRPQRGLKPKKPVGRPPAVKTIKGRLLIFPLDLSNEDADWCPGLPHPSNVELDVFTRQYLLGPDSIPSLAACLDLFDLCPEFHIEGEQAEKGFLADAICDAALAHLAERGIHIHSPGPHNEHISKLSILTTVKSSRKLAFRPMTRPAADIAVIDLKKHCIPRVKDSFYVFLCPRGLQSYLIAQVHKLPVLRSDVTSIVRDILHHCFAVRVWDAICDLDASEPPAIAGRCVAICQRVLSNHALATLGGWKSTTPVRPPSSQAVASEPLFLGSDSMDHSDDMQDLWSYFSAPTTSTGALLSPGMRTVSPTMSFEPLDHSVLASPVLPPATPAASTASDGRFQPAQALHPFPPAASSSAAAASSSANAQRPARYNNAPRRAEPSNPTSFIRSFEVQYGLEPSPPRDPVPPSQPFAFDAMWTQTTVAPLPAEAPSASLPFGGLALLAQLAGPMNTNSAPHAFDMTVAASHPTGGDSSDSSSDDSDGDDDDLVGDALFHSDDDDGDRESNMDEDASSSAGEMTVLAPVLSHVDHVLWLPRREAFEERLLANLPTIPGTLRFSYYAGRNLGQSSDGRVPLGDILHYLFKSMFEREPPRSANRISRMVMQKFPTAQINVSGFSPRALFGSSYVFEVGIASGDGVRDAFIATAMDQFTSKPHWRKVGHYKIPFLLPYGRIEPDDITDLKAAGTIAAWAITQAKIIPGLHPLLVFLFAAGKLLNRSLRDESLLALLVDPVFVRAIDPTAHAALSLWPDSHDKPIPPLLDPNNAALATLHEWLGELNLPIDTVRSRSFHHSFTIGLYSHALVGINLSVNEVPRGWDIVREALDVDISMSDYPIAATPLTQLFFKPFGLRDTEQEEIYNMKLLIVALAGSRPTAQGIISRVRYETFVAEHADDVDLPVVVSVPADLRGEDPDKPPPPPDVVQAVRPTLFASVLTGWNTMPCVSIGAARTSLAFIFRFVYVDDPEERFVNPLAPPLSVHVCTHTIDFRVNKPFREMVARSAATLRHAAEQAAGDQFVDTEFDLYFHSQLLLEARAHFNNHIAAHALGVSLANSNPPSGRIVGTILTCITRPDAALTFQDPKILIIAADRNIPPPLPVAYERVTPSVLVREAYRMPRLAPAIHLIRERFDVSGADRLILYLTGAIIPNCETLLLVDTLEVLDWLLALPAARAAGSHIPPITLTAFNAVIPQPTPSAALAQTAAHNLTPDAPPASSSAAPTVNSVRDPRITLDATPASSTAVPSTNVASDASTRSENSPQQGPHYIYLPPSGMFPWSRMPRRLPRRPPPPAISPSLLPYITAVSSTEDWLARSSAYQNQRTLAFAIAMVERNHRLSEFAPSTTPSPPADGQTPPQ